MTIALAVALIVSLWVPFLLTLLHARDRRDAETRWTEERRELLTRIQHPQIVPTRPVDEFVAPVREPDEWNKVGTIDLSENGDDGS